MDLRSPFEQIVPKPMINIGALFDISTGDWQKGPRGEWVLSGGLAYITGVVGRGNLGKTLIMDYMSFRAMARMKGSAGSKYDTEINVQPSRPAHLARQIEEFEGEEILETRRWVITDKERYYANVWWKEHKEWLNEKKKNKASLMRLTPFMTRDNKTGQPVRLSVMTPTFTQIDSFTHFETEDVAEIREKVELGNKDGLTQHMKQGLAKNTFIMETPAVMASANNYLLMSAHVGLNINMGAGPGQAPPAQPLKYMKNGDVIKGATAQFTFLTQNCWHVYNASPLINQGTKGVEYPRNSNDDTAYDTDLNVVSLRLIRGKSGASGVTIDLLTSQADGVLPSLTEFHYIKENARYGINGTLQHYELDLLPGTKLSRTTVRGKIDEDEKLRRALNITSEMCQMENLWHHMEEGILCTPKQLYDDLKAKGYDWDVLLATRGWWTLDDDHPIPFLSTMDLLKMRLGEYHPYWYDAVMAAKKQVENIQTLKGSTEALKEVADKKKKKEAVAV